MVPQKSSSMDERDAEETRKRVDLLSEKVKVLQSDLSNICSQIHEKTDEKNRIEQELVLLKQQLEIQKTKYNSELERLQNEFQEKVDGLEQNIKQLTFEKETLSKELEQNKVNLLKIIHSLQSSIKRLTEQKEVLDKQVSDLTKQVFDKQKDLDRLNNLFKELREKYLKNEQIYQNELEKTKQNKNQIQLEINQLLSEKENLEKQNTELKAYKRYLDKREKQLSEKENRIEKIYNLLTQNYNGIQK